MILIREIQVKCEDNDGPTVHECEKETAEVRKSSRGG